MERMVIHTAKCVAEMKGFTSCGEVRRVIEQTLTPEGRERVLAQEARWEAFQRAAWEDEKPEEPELTPRLLCDAGVCVSQGEARRLLRGAPESKVRALLTKAAHRVV